MTNYLPRARLLTVRAMKLRVWVLRETPLRRPNWRPRRSPGSPREGWAVEPFYQFAAVLIHPAPKRSLPRRSACILHPQTCAFRAYENGQHLALDPRKFVVLRLSLIHI